eukprot:2399171-Prymnesium_polylepis.1
MRTTPRPLPLPSAFERTTGGSHAARPGALSVGPERGKGSFSLWFEWGHSIGHPGWLLLRA